MSVDRPTFSENWHRVASLRPRLRTVVRCYRQSYRGRMWHVLDDPTNNQFFRVDDSAYHFIALLNGRRTVAEAWDIANEDLGDAAPTQGEAIRLLGQLYTSNLLHAELPPDAEQMFERYKRRIRREVGGYLASFLFLKIPLWDPNIVLKTWERAFGWFFTPLGFVVWAAILAVGGYHVAGRWEEAIAGAHPQSLLATENLALLYLSFAAIKFIHEMGHGLACVHFGRKEGTSGAVHTMGIMLLVLMPVPYVDATSSWAFRSKWRRAFVAAAGMYVELAVASIAAVIWANTADQTVAHEIAYNAMIVASVSTLLFNANPLLRFDGYYILSDVLEIANLAGRSKQYLYYLVRKYIYGVPRTQSPAHSPNERAWLLVYAVASTIYRVIISIGILLMLVEFLPEELVAVSLLLVLLSLLMWVLVPAGKFVKYLATSPELERTRPRAQLVSALVIGGLVAGLGLIPVADRGRAEGVVEPASMAVVHMPVDGVVRSVLPTTTRVTPTGAPLLVADNRELEAERRELEAELSGLRTRREMARAEDPAVVEALTGRINATSRRIERLGERIARLRVAAPLEGVWVSDDTKDVTGVYLRRGERIGIVADTGDLLVRIAADQSIGPRIREEIGVDGRIDLRVKGEPDIRSGGVITQLPDTGRSELPSEALGYHAGGSMAIATDAERGTQTAERFFEVIVRPDDASRLMVGQIVVVRFSMPPRPLLAQWYNTVRQLVQRRFAL